MPGGYKIELTLIDADLSDRSPLMQEEIFGPLLPVVRYGRSGPRHWPVSAAGQNRWPLYLFTRSAGRVQQVERTVSFGGGCVNDCVLHLSSTRLPFGGVGEAASVPIMAAPALRPFPTKNRCCSARPGLDPPFRYPPFAGKLPLFQLFLR